MEVQLTSKLSRITATTVHILAFVTGFAYGTYHYLQHNPVLASLSCVACGAVLMSQWMLVKGQDARLYKHIFLAALTAAVVVTSYQFGYRGLILAFPMTACLLLILNYRIAIALSIAVMFVALAASLNVLETETVFRYAVALFLSVCFSATFAFSLNKQKESLDKEANQDFLTGIASRRGFATWFESYLAQPENKRRPFALFYIDIDDFKRINDTLGHAAGDEVLIQFCKRVRSCLRDKDTIITRGQCMNFGRLAGDEFVLVIPDVSMRDVAARIAARIVAHLSAPFSVGHNKLSVHMSMGIAMREDFHARPEDLIAQADCALYYAKNRGKNQYQFFDAELARSMLERQRIARGLTQALQNGAFDLVFMPIYDSLTLEINGAEVLIRCSDESLAGIGPDRYIAVAEEQGLIREIDLLVLEKTLSRISNLHREGRFKRLRFSINISALELHNSEFPNSLARLLAQYKVPANIIELEITETSLALQDESCMQILKEIKALGVRLALDDFGTGYTAFNQLMNYPVDTLKIDRTFVRDTAGLDTQDRSIADTILTIADHYNLIVVAEGVETWEQFNYLNERNCQYVQGYLFSKPLPWDEFIHTVLDRSHKPGREGAPHEDATRADPVPALRGCMSG